ncbi:TonB-dependent siderophore receptor [Methylomonas sp. CM2]|uniref:TonB-dependent siderophore receptor n=1 Tax=Methylomonas sp. CM2 TaxID=3417647 RepID=UPI003CF3C0D8
MSHSGKHCDFKASRQQKGNRPRHALKAVALLCAMAASSGAIAENAGSGEVYKFNISAGDMSASLNKLAETANVELSYPAAMASDMKSNGLKGNYTVEQALQQLLKGSGLNYRVAGGNSITVEKVAVAQANDATTMAAVTVTGARPGYDAADPYTKDYAVPSSSAASKTEMALMETPVNIQIVPRTIMDDQQDIEITEALSRNVSGVQRSPDYGDLYENFNIRGFSTNFSTYRNGLRRYTNYSDPANIEQVEVIKGPAAVLYGQIQPGGMVNVVTKQALDKPYYSLQQQFGNYDQYRTTAAATGPIDDAKTLKYRFDASYQDLSSFKKYVGDERVFIAPKLSWTPNDRFEANAELEFKHDKRVNDNGIPTIGNRPAPVAFNTYLGDVAKGPTMNSVLTAFDWSYKFNNQWKVTNRFMHEDWDINYFDLQPQYMLNATMLRRFPITGVAYHDTYGTNLDLIGNVELFNTKHELLIGGDFSRRTRKADKNRFACCNGNNTGGTVDIYNPAYNTVDLAAIYSSPYDYAVREKEEWFGVYFQDHITLFEKLHILGGGRYDWATFGRGSDFATGSYDVASANYKSTDNQKFSPRVGILYQPMSWLSVYGNYTESLGSANTGMVYGNQSIKPEIGEQFEAGFKTEFFDQRLSSTVSFYHLTKQNIQLSDPIHTGLTVTAGEARSQGIEADLKGRVTDDLNLILTYAYTDARITKNGENSDEALGKRLINVPEHQASLWGTYQFTPEFKAGIGGVLVGSRAGQTWTDLELPGYARMDMMAAYVKPIGKTRLTTQLNINNVLDKEYYAGATRQGASNTITGNPITVMGSLKLEY